MPRFQRYLRNFAFYVIILTGGLLSLVSIIVVLEMRDPSIPEELSVTALRQSLDTAQAVSRAQLSAAIPTADTTLERAVATDTIRHRGTLLTLYAAQRAAAETWSIRRNSVLAAQAEASAAAATTWRVDSGRTGNRDHEERFLELRDWYRTEIQKTDAYLDSGRVHLAASYAALASLRLARAPTDVAAREAEARGHLKKAETLLAGYPRIDSIPPWEPDQRLFDRGDWMPHPIAALSDWLRTSRSMELASVIGMLGLGLLGAAASTVVRQRSAASDAELVLGDDITTLLLSGMSAALATYLAVKGGLAVTSANNAEPNPYVLLLTCFVAAVYWDEAWERVRKFVSGANAPGASKTETFTTTQTSTTTASTTAPVPSSPTSTPGNATPAAGASPPAKPDPTPAPASVTSTPEQTGTTSAAAGTGQADAPSAPQTIPSPVEKVVGVTEGAAVNGASDAVG